MRSAFLTGSAPATDDRRAATWLMTVFSIGVVSLSTAARADEPPPSLIARALRNDSPGAPPSERAVAAAQWIPQLRLKAIVSEHALAGQNRVETIMFGELAWPLGRTPVGDRVAAAEERRQRSIARDALVDADRGGLARAPTRR